VSATRYPRGQRIDDEATLFAELRRLADAGVRIVPRELAKVDRGRLWRACYALFGSIPRARAAAGIPAPRRLLRPTAPVQMSREQAIEALRSACAGRSEAPGKRHLPAPLRRAIRHWFGGYQRALVELGLGVEGAASHQRWTRETVLAALRDRQRRGLSMSSHDLQRERSDLFNATIRHIGRFSLALALAGLKPAPVRRTASPASRVRAAFLRDVARVMRAAFDRALRRPTTRAPRSGFPPAQIGHLRGALAVLRVELAAVAHAMLADAIRAEWSEKGIWGRASSGAPARRLPTWGARPASSTPPIRSVPARRPRQLGASPRRAGSTPTNSGRASSTPRARDAH